MFQIIKKILIFDKDNLGKYKIHFLKERMISFIQGGKTLQTYLALNLMTGCVTLGNENCNQV